MQPITAQHPAAMPRFGPEPRRSRRLSLAGDYWHFLKAFALRPMTVGAVAPSSRRLAEAMMPPSGLESASVVVELGAGTGAVTREISRRLDPDATLISVEIDPSAARRLRTRFSRIRLVCGRAEHLRRHLRRCGHSQADCVISGIPWRNMPGEVQRRTLRTIAASLRPGGTFTAMAYLHASAYPSARRFRAELDRHFASVTSSRIVWGNLPPAFVYYAHSPRRR